MRVIYSDPESSKVGLYKSILEEAGILCFIQNDNTSRGEVVVPAFYPTLCITDDGRYEEALALLKDIHLAEPVAGADWMCPKCNESVPSSFESCWNCETLKPA
ncbi:MAG: DUF2007 domain-containing protein [Verrucomicrobiaceae bacterium]|nr:DUF2007 domain-containing protein [Verrucomicrobiaceae bacterium]